MSSSSRGTVTPKTAASRSTERAAVGSRSIWAARSASTECGSSSMPERTAATSSRRKSGLPPACGHERLDLVPRKRQLVGHGVHERGRRLRRQQLEVDRDARHVVGEREPARSLPAGDEDEPRVLLHARGRREPAPPPRPRPSSARRRERRWFDSASAPRAGRSAHRAGARGGTAPRADRPSASTPPPRPSGMARRGSQARSSGTRSSTSARSRAATASGLSCSPSPSSVRSARPTARYGVDESYSSQATSTARKPSPRSSSSSTSRDLPTPGSPMSSTTVPRPLRAAARARSSSASSASLPTSGDELPRSRRSARRAPTANAANGCALPFSAKGPRGSALERRARSHERGLGRENLAELGLAHDAGGRVDRVTLDRVGAAVWGPKFPENTRPELTPMRIGMRQRASMI